MLVGEAVSKKKKKKTRKNKFTRKLRSYIVQGNNNELYHRRVRALPLRLCNWHTHNTDTHTHTHPQTEPDPGFLIFKKYMLYDL